MGSKHLKYVRRILLSLDQFSSPINFQMKGEALYRTYLGSFLTLLLFCLILYTFIVQTIDLLNGSKPNVISSEQFTPNPELFILNQNNFHFQVGLVDFFSKPIVQTKNETIFTLHVNVCTRTVNPDLTINMDCKINRMVKCDSLLFEDNLLPPEYNQYLYCIPPYAWQEGIMLNGYLQSQNFTVISIAVQKCENKTLDYFKQNEGYIYFLLLLVCASIGVINQRLENFYLAYAYSDYLLDQSESGNPYKMYGKVQQYSLTSRSYSSLFIYLRHSITRTINHFFYYFGENILENHVLQFSRQESKVDVIDYVTIATLKFVLDDSQIIYTRTYETILKVFAEVGGLYKLLFSIFAFFQIPVAQQFKRIELANYLFSYSQQEGTKIKDAKQENKLEQARKNKYLEMIKNEETINALENQSVQVKELKKYFSLNNDQSKIKLKEIIQSWFSKQKIISRTKQKINKRLDVVYILNKLNELKYLKKLILSQHQQIVFRLIQKPKITINNLQSSESLINKKILTKLLNQFNSMQKTIEQTNENQIDEKLYELLDDRMKEKYNLNQEHHSQDSKAAEINQDNEIARLQMDTIKSSPNEVY